ncbi:MAG: class I SAM-dependent methyltransferase [Ilumatobacteraceae bacterium]
MGLRARLLRIPIAYELLTFGLTKPDTYKWLVDEIMLLRPGMKVLDVGCGTASVLKLLPQVEYVGIDHNPDYIAKARTTYGNKGRFEVCDVNDPAFKEFGVFDRVMLLGVLHHLDDSECSHLMRSLAECLAPNGRIITFDNTLAKGQHPIARMFSKLDRGRYSRSPDGYRAIVESVFKIEHDVVRHDLMRVPYSHAAIRARAHGEVR